MPPKSDIAFPITMRPMAASYLNTYSQRLPPGTQVRHNDTLRGEASRQRVHSRLDQSPVRTAWRGVLDSKSVQKSGKLRMVH